MTGQLSVAIQTIPALSLTPFPSLPLLPHQTAAPSPEKIPDGNLLGVTVVLITCSYKGREFVRIGYYVNNTLPGMSTTPEDESGAADEGDDVDMEDDDVRTQTHTHTDRQPHNFVHHLTHSTTNNPCRRM